MLDGTRRVVPGDVRQRRRLARAAGTWRYAADPTTEIVCVGYAIDDGSTEIWTPGQPVLAATDDVELGCARCHRVHEHIRLGTKVHR